MPPRVAMYLRQSLDQDAGMAVERQREGCLTRIAQRGWTVDPDLVFVDNSVSASSRKPRPAYERMLSAIRTGRIDVVVAWNLDRLTRSPREMEDWFDLNRVHGVNLLTSEGEDLVDLSGEAGRMVLRMTAAVARMEIERKARRQRESNDQGRALGIPPGGKRAFGYTPRIRTAKGVTAARLGEDGRTWPDYGHEPIPEEAAAVRRGYELLLTGASLLTIAREWNAAGFRTQDWGSDGKGGTNPGKPWGPFTTRAVLASPRYAALVRPPRVEGTTRWDASGYDLSVLTPGTWEPLVSLETWTAAQQVLRDPSRRTSKGQQRTYLLSGFARCGVPINGQPCGALVKAGRSAHNLRSYRCREHHHLQQQADPVDELVIAVTLARLARPDAARLLERRDAPDLGVLRAEYQAKRARRDQLAELIADGTLTADEVRATSKRLKAELVRLQERMSDAGRVDVLGPLVNADDVETAWNGLTIDVQRAVIATLMDVTIASPGVGHKRAKDRERRLAETARSVSIRWHEG